MACMLASVRTTGVREPLKNCFRTSLIVISVVQIVLVRSLPSDLVEHGYESYDGPRPLLHTHVVGVNSVDDPALNKMRYELSANMDCNKLDCGNGIHCRFNFEG
eukprot:5706644-Amphidinium_carterae.1